MSKELHPGLHPDVDTLNAFLEGALPEHERIECLNHLAECAECREVVFLAEGAAARTETPATAKEAAVPFWRKLFRPAPVITAVAAAILIVTSIGLYRMIRSAERSAEVTASARLPLEIAPEPKTVQPVPEPPPALSGKAAPRRTPVKPSKAPLDRADAPSPPLPAQTSAAAPVPGTSANALTAPAEAPPLPRSAPLAAVAGFSAPPNEAGIAGTVTNTAGAGIPGAQVELKNRSNGATYRSTSDSQGEFSLARLLPGRYELSVTSTGFKKLIEPSIDLQPQTIARVDSRLEAGAAAEAVTVNAEASLLKTESGEPGPSAGFQSAAQSPSNGRGFPALTLGPSYTLPDGSNPVSFAVKDSIVVAADSRGAVFRSEDRGKRWKRVKGRWKGRAARVVMSADKMFELTTDSAVIWVSADGRSWSQVPALR